MPIRRLSKLVAVLLALVSARAGAQQVVNIADIRCVAVGMRLSGMSNSPDQSRGILLTLYYMGRLDGRVPQLDIEDLLIKVSGKMTNSDYATEAKRCGADLANKGQQITKLGNDLIERGKNTVQPIPAQ